MQPSLLPTVFPKYFIIPKRNIVPIKQQLPFPQPLFYCLSVWICLFRGSHTNRIIQYLSFCVQLLSLGASLVARLVKNLPAMQETRVWSLGQEDPLEKGMASPSSTLAWRIPWTEDLVGHSPWDCKESDTTVRLTFLSFLSLSTMSSRFMYVAACIRTSNPFKGWIIFHCVYRPHFVYPFICWWTSGSFAPLAVVNSAAMNISESLQFLFTLALTLQSGVLLWGRWKGSGGKGEVIALYPHLELPPSFQREGPQRGSPHGNMGNGGSWRWQRSIQQGHLRERKCGRFPITSLCREHCVGLSLLQMSPLDATRGGDGGPSIPHLFGDCIYST